MIRTDKGLDFWARQCMAVAAAAALAFGWATTVAAYDSPTATGQRLCYQLEHYPAIPDPVTGVLTPGDIVFRDANGVTELDPATGQPNPVCDPAAPSPGCFDPSTAAVNDQVIPCKGTGQDGEKFYGLKLRYTDRGDGRIYDINTGLTWEKKSDDGGLHDKDNIYTWEEAFAYVKQLNNICQNDENLACATDADCAAVGGLCGFAGKRDWRLPNIKELGTIVNFAVFSNELSPAPTVDPVFNTTCVPGATVLTGSCTHSDDIIYNPGGANDGDFVPYGTLDPVTGLRVGLRVPMTYWTSTTGDALGDAWFADFFTGDNGAHFKGTDIDIDTTGCDPNCSPANPPIISHTGHVRAVRGGETGLYQD